MNYLNFEIGLPPMLDFKMCEHKDGVCFAHCSDHIQDVVTPSAGFQSSLYEWMDDCSHSF